MRCRASRFTTLSLWNDRGADRVSDRAIKGFDITDSNGKIECDTMRFVCNMPATPRRRSLMISLKQLTIVVIIALSVWAGAEEEDKNKEEPFAAYEGEITGKRVNVRSGPGKNFTRVLKVNKGYKVLVTGRHGEWLRIRVPDECLLWIWKDYVKLDEETNTGTVTDDNVNVRIAPKLGADVVGQVDEGSQVAVTGGEGDWYEIKPPPTTSAWVHSDYVKRVEAEE